MSLASEILARRMRLPAPQTRDIVRERDLRVPMDDGIVLLADRWVARASAGTPQPTVLVRSPYGRSQLLGVIFGRLLAERGLQVVIQSVRGTFGSGGSFSPFDERADGLATLRWIRAQPWHRDALVRVSPEAAGAAERSPDGSWRVPVELWPIGHRFASGHRVRLQVSSGAHPRYARNPGTGEDLLAARTLRAVDVELLYGEAHPSRLVLPVPVSRR